MNKNRDQKQVSLAGAAHVQQKETTSSFSWKWVLIVCGLPALLLVGVLLFFAFDKEDAPALSARDMVDYVYTPDALADDVAYYLLGVTGDKVGDPMDMLAVMCYDRKAGTASLIQLPVSTYIDKEIGFAVDTIGDVWYHPAPDIFCSSCRVRVPEEERDETYHATCGATLEKRTGSATGDLIRVINEQYGLPIDNYIILPRAGVVKLIDAFEGVEVELSKKITLAGESYAKGVQTLSGQAAVEYAVTYNYKSTPASDRERMLRQRQVFAALWQRVADCELEDLYYVDKNGSTKGIVGSLMLGTNRIRFNTTSFGKARLLNISEEKAADMKLSDAISRFIWNMGQVKPENVTVSILPGQASKSGTLSVYSVNRAQTIELFNQQMNPYGFVLDESTVTVPQVVEKPKTADPETVTLADVLPAAEGEE